MRMSYDTQTMADTVAAPGQLTRTVHTISSGEQVGSHSVALAYDTLGRLMGREVSIDGNAALTFEEQYTYDQYGRPFQKFDASDDFAGVRYHYNSAGYLAKVSESAKAVPVNPGATTTAPVAYYTVTAMNARGQVTRATLGNGVVLDRTYQAASGYLNVMKATNGMSQELQKLTLTFDELGNLTQRRDQGRSKMTSLAKNMIEAFTYDNLNRLKTTRITGVTSANVDTTYDARGNIKTKSGVGTYAYGATSNRLVSVTPSGGTAVTYAYDSNGNLTSGDGRTLSYTSFDKPHTITKGTGQSVQFAYDGERARYTRYKRSVTTGTGTSAVTTTTYYVGNVEIRNVTGGKQYTRYVGGHAIVKLTRNDTSRTAISTDYLITDHLGSIDAIADSSGALLYDLSFDAWGRRRAADSSYAIINTPATALATLTPRGFTGHEMLDTVGLIHMNGRVYDPRLGRFTSADPIVQFPHYSQSFNHYSYVLNNPLGYTDPSGYGIKFKQVIGIIVAAIGTYICGPDCGTLGYSLIGASSGAASAAANDGNILQGAVIGAFSGAAFSGVAGADYSSFGAYQGVARFGAFGAVGGITSVVSGGKFGHGFLSAGIGSSVGSIPGLEGREFQDAFNRVLVGAVAGGTISEITGGKFANGAATAAFAAIVNEGVRPATSDSGADNTTITDQDKIAAINADLEAANIEALKVSGKERHVVDWARQKSTALYGKHGVEFGGTIVENGDSFGIGRIVTDYQTSRLPSLSRLGGYAHFHTHPSTNNFGTGDVSVAVVNRLNKSFIFLSDGSTRVFNSVGYRQIHDWRSLRHYMSAQEIEAARGFIGRY